ncbi:hypothetical protein DB347_19800 [Opitutaceae bacterium EW11]|nr:hypothetical protein DB347_19800 [Opitutaceae bacterium EW11]
MSALDGQGGAARTVGLKLPLLVWIAAEFVLLASILVLSSRLPESVAVHFDAAGRANGWMSRSAHIGVFSALSLGLPGFVVGLCAAIRFAPAALFNVPNASYWRAPANYPTAGRLLLHRALWLGVGMCVWSGAFHALIIAANLETPPRLSQNGMAWFNGVSLGCLALWILWLYRTYSRSPKA